MTSAPIKVEWPLGSWGLLHPMERTWAGAAAPGLAASRTPVMPGERVRTDSPTDDADEPEAAGAAAAARKEERSERGKWNRWTALLSRVTIALEDGVKVLEPAELERLTSQRPPYLFDGSPTPGQPLGEFVSEKAWRNEGGGEVLLGGCCPLPL